MHCGAPMQGELSTGDVDNCGRGWGLCGQLWTTSGVSHSALLTTRSPLPAKCQLARRNEEIPRLLHRLCVPRDAEGQHVALVETSGAVLGGLRVLVLDEHRLSTAPVDSGTDHGRFLRSPAGMPREGPS